MGEGTERISIFAAADDAFARPMAAMLCSVVANLRPGVRAHFTLGDGGISRRNRRRLDTLLEHLDCEVEWPRIDESRFAGIEATRRFTLPVYFRVLIPDLVPPDVDRAIYLDSDVIVLGDLASLWEVELGDVSLGAVIDPVRNAKPSVEVSGNYFNSGMFLCNVLRWREQGSVAKILRFLAEGDYKADQDALNVFFDGDWLELDPRWNVVSPVFSMESPPKPLLAAREDPAVVHFTGPRSRKPWASKPRHPLTHVYLDYESRTPWAGSLPVGAALHRRALAALGAPWGR